MDIIKERVISGVCPLCNKEINKGKKVNHSKHGEVEICEHHKADGEGNE